MSEENTQPTPAPQAETTPEPAAPPADAATPEAGAPAATAPAGPATAKAEAATRPPWWDVVDQTPAEDIRRHPKFAGIVGSERQRWQQDWETQNQERTEREAAEKAHNDLREKARANPVAFADEWLNKDDADQQQARLSNLETNARQAVGRQIGAAMHAIPEWGDMASDPDVLATLAKALEGKSNDEVLTAWNTTAVELVASRRAEKLAEARLAERMKQERAAWETEAAARGLQTSDRPDLIRGGRLASADPEPPAGTPEWHAWYERSTPGARRIATVRR